MTNPAHYTGIGRGEAQLRADFAHYYWLSRDIAPESATPQVAAERTAVADGLAAKWKGHPKPRWRAVWQELQTTADRWKHRPDATRRIYEQLTTALPPGAREHNPAWRTLRDTGLITERLAEGVAGSAQDQARWFPQNPSVAPSPDRSAGRRPQRASAAEASTRPTAFDRALGGRAENLAGMVEVEAIIEATDLLLGEEEALGDLDTGAEARAALLPAERRTAPIVYDYSGEAESEARQIAALRQLQDLTAEHTRLVGRWEGTLDSDQDQIERLEQLIAAARSVRTAALTDGAAPADVDAVYHAGCGGTYWSDRPGSPRMGRIASLIQERDHARAEAAALRTGTPVSKDIGVDAGLASGVTDGVALHGAEGPGAVISDAVDAAFPAGDIGAEFWDEIDTHAPSPPPSTARDIEIHL
ncbi:hypothetical protein ACFWPH_32900 [Nocardia sp. NPDC058499]|uniref:hypothetical protein n=1 Tax=Nocardia sp. NPDC058499 TaxID=3346530 RepID=UPI00365738B3